MEGWDFIDGVYCDLNVFTFSVEKWFFEERGTIMHHTVLTVCWVC